MSDLVIYHGTIRKKIINKTNPRKLATPGRNLSILSIGSKKNLKSSGTVVSAVELIVRSCS